MNAFQAKSYCFFLEKGSRIQAQVLRSLFAYKYNSSGLHFHSTSCGVIRNQRRKMRRNPSSNAENTQI